MTPEENAQELSYKFDIYYNSITSNQAPGLSEYEKSVFLTKAQDEILKNYFNPKGNKYQEGFDGSEKRQIDFSVITVKWAAPSITNSGLFDERENGVYNVTIPDNIMMIINERIEATRGGKDINLVVVPISYDEYDRLMSKPYKRPLKNQAWRVITHDDNHNKADLILGPSDELSQYIIRYIRQPKPIIVGDTDELTINGYTYGNSSSSETQGCELDPILHEEILQRAVELAKAAWITTGQENLQALMQVGQRSE